MKLKPEVYIKAAKLIANKKELFACNALVEICDKNTNIYINNLNKFFKPKKVDGDLPWYSWDE